jgi:hypothetical protein
MTQQAQQARVQTTRTLRPCYVIPLRYNAPADPAEAVCDVSDAAEITVELGDQVRATPPHRDVLCGRVEAVDEAAGTVKVWDAHKCRSGVFALADVVVLVKAGALE